MMPHLNLEGIEVRDQHHRTRLELMVLFNQTGLMW